jgi:hypothetical protein
VPPAAGDDHGGPTAGGVAGAQRGVEYGPCRGFARSSTWTYGGSTGYGRADREELRASGADRRCGLPGAAACLAGGGGWSPARLLHRGARRRVHHAAALGRGGQPVSRGPANYVWPTRGCLAADTHKFEEGPLPLDWLGHLPALPGGLRGPLRRSTGWTFLRRPLSGAAGSARTRSVVLRAERCDRGRAARAGGVRSDTCCSRGVSSTASCRSENVPPRLGAG